ncbi:MAG: insulinase family protein [Phycisphaerae bacterium]|nr:insulinase family protein [Phycisphaerae bacterium]
MKPTFVEHQLPNGLRVICECMPQVRSAAAAFLVRTGARHETPPEHGVSHFLEHMCFKGTAKRSCREINVGFDELGAIYNAYTGKEHTVYYGWVPGQRIRPQLELLADMMRPSLPPDEFEMERKVVLEEIAMSGDSFDHNVSNFLHEVCYDGHALAHEILGERETIEALPRDHMVSYLAERYAPNNIYLLATGAIEPQEVLAAAGRYCGDWQRARNGRPPAAAPPPFGTGVRKRQLTQFQQQSLMLVYPALPPGTGWDESIDVFVALFGGANSRCYWNIVQKGICNQAGVAWLAYEDTGMLAFYADGEPDRCEEMLTAVREQIAAAVRDGVNADELERVKNRRRTHLALEAENPRTRLMQLIDDIESYGHVRTPDARLAAVDAVSTRTIADYFERCPLAGDGLLLSIGARDWPV